MLLARILFLPTSLAALVSAAFVVPLPVFVEVPTAPIPIEQSVTVRDGTVAGEPVQGSYLIAAVTLTRGTAVRVVRSVVDGQAELVAERRVIPPGVDDDAYFARQRDVFRVTAELAAAIGMQAAGLPVDPSAITGDGVLVVDVVAGSPADGLLRPGDLIVGIEGTPVRTSEDLREVITARGTTPLELVVDRDGQSERVGLTPTLHEGRPVIGIVPETVDPRLQLPVEVDVDLDRIGGPSAGLMVALTVYDLVASEDLAAGRRIAGTGGILPDGSVETIGGIRHKAAAAAGAGIDVFLVPEEQLAEARRGVPAGTAMRLVGVRDFAHAVRALRGTAAALRVAG